MADRGNLTEEQKELFEGAVQTLERMQVLISDLLEYGVLVDQKAPEDAVVMTDVVAEIVMDLKTYLSEADAEIAFGTLPTIQGHRSQMRMLVQNMISNAVAYRRDDVRPRMMITSGAEKDGMIPIHFEDNACGIPEDQFDKIFGVFTRLFRHEEISGSGVGLAVCKRVALNHDATITVTSTMGAGSRFTLHLPKERCIT